MRSHELWHIRWIYPQRSCTIHILLLAWRMAFKRSEWDLGGILAEKKQAWRTSVQYIFYDETSTQSQPERHLRCYHPGALARKCKKQLNNIPRGLCSPASAHRERAPTTPQPSPICFDAKTSVNTPRSNRIVQQNLSFDYSRLACVKRRCRLYQDGWAFVASLCRRLGQRRLVRAQNADESWSRKPSEECVQSVDLAGELCTKVMVVSWA